jgi:ribosomal protein S18 acetylase RimI-like enzyme
MQQIKIENYQDTYFKEMTALITQSFLSKLCHRQSLSPNDIKKILYLTWDINTEDTGYLHYVAKEEEKVIGVILIQYGKKQKRTSRKKISIFALIRRYGFYNMLFLIYKLSVLEIHKPKNCYIEHIAVDESMRGRGIGEMLLSHGERVLKDMGFSSLSLAVAKENPAKHLYDRMGFKDIKDINSRYKGFFTGINEWIFMGKEID